MALYTPHLAICSITGFKIASCSYIATLWRQQMMELLLARMKEHVQEMTARTDAIQAEMKADQAKANASQQDFLARMEEVNANQEKGGSQHEIQPRFAGKVGS
jgi:hypothetical protein